MSNIAFTGNASGSGTVTVTAPNTSTNRTLTLPDNTGTLFSSADIATDPVALAGTSTTTLMTPALVKYQRSNETRTRVTGSGTGLVLTATEQLLAGTPTFVASTPLVLLTCMFHFSVTTAATVFDAFSRLILYTAAGAEVDFYSGAYSFTTGMVGLGAAQSGSITLAVPVTPGASYYGRVLCYRPNASIVASVNGGRIDVVCL